MKTSHVLGLLGVVVVIGIGGLLISGKLPVTVQFVPPSPSATEKTTSTSASAAPSADEQGLGTPEAFVAAIYAHFVDSATDANWNWTANDGADYFDSELVALMKEDARLNEGYIGAIEAVPFCDCQDYNALKADIRSEAVSADHARVIAIVQEKNAATAGRFVYDLVKVDGRWRIADIHTPNLPSLKQLLIRSNAQSAKAATSATASS